MRPVVALARIVKSHLDDDLVGFDILAGKLGTLFTRPFHAVLCLVCHCAAVGARAFAECCRSRANSLTLWNKVRDGGDRFFFLEITLVLQARPLGVKIPRRLRHELRDVRIDLIALDVLFGRHCTGFPGLLQLALAPAVVGTLVIHSCAPSTVARSSLLRLRRLKETTHAGCSRTHVRSKLRERERQKGDVSKL